MGIPVTLVVDGDCRDHCLIDAVRPVLEASDVKFEWEVVAINEGVVSEDVLASARRTQNVLMPYIEGRREEGKPAPIVALRKALSVYANIRPIHSVPELKTRFEDVDVIIVRETTEDIYASMEHESIEGTFESLKVTTRGACEQIAREAFSQARRLGRKKVTTVHKSNIMKKSDGMFLNVSREIAKEYPDIEHDDCIVDALCMKLAMYPERFDVLLCGNLFGDIVADLAAGLVGGRSNCPSMNLTKDGIEIFTSGHADLAEHARSRRENPMSLLFASVLLLRHLGRNETGDRLMAAIRATLAEGIMPHSAGGTADTTDFTQAVQARLG